MNRSRRKASIYLPSDISEALDAEAERLDRTRSWMVQQALRVFLPKVAALPAAPGKGGTR